ncbi:MAG: thioesterase domain-containing protein [Woeseiaceae bacterium]|nr:thioesterase domain-containing protein [Woeseiaceae bacterium]
MSELSNKLEQLSDTDRVRLFRELMERSGESPPPSVRELVLVYEEGSDANPEALRAAAASRLPEHERPTRFIATGSLPRTPHGKLDRRGLPGLVRPEQPATETADAVQTGANGVMSSAIATFSKVLGGVAVGPDSNFFELGGHSLLAVDCILELEESSGERISITEFLNHPTPRGIAALLHEQSERKYDYIYPVSENTSGLPVFVFSSALLAYALKPQREDWSIYGVQFRWRDDDDREIHYDSVQHMAEFIAAEISHLCGHGDFLLIGSSFSAMVAFEVARQLQSTGREPALTILIEPSLLHGRRAWFEFDLHKAGKLKQGQNPYLKWLLVNNPLRARFWRRLSELSAKRREAVLSDGSPSGTREEADAYEFARTKSLRLRYQPSEYSGPSTLIACLDNAWLIGRDWQPRLNEDCLMHILDTDHRGILRDPFMSRSVVPVVVEEIEQSVT